MQTTIRIKISFGFLCPYNTTHLAPLCTVLALVGTMGDTRGRAVVQQAIVHCCKGVYPYTITATNICL